MIAPVCAMDNRRLEKLIHQEAEILEGRLGFWRLDYQDRLVFVITDEVHNRMRIMTPVAEETDLEEDDLKIVLAANFDRALDAKYALADDYLWSVFMHPLRELTDDLFLDALEQVRSLAENYGSSYASSDLFFGDGEA